MVVPLPRLSRTRVFTGGGATSSNRMSTSAGWLVFPARSVVVNTRWFMPETRVTVCCQLVAEVRPTTSAPFSRMLAYASLAPVMVWLMRWVGEVTGLTAGGSGGVVSTVKEYWSRLPAFPKLSLSCMETVYVESANALDGVNTSWLSPTIDQEPAASTWALFLMI